MAIECGVMSFEAAFMSHMLLASGERVIDRVQSEKSLPPADDPSLASKPMGRPASRPCGPNSADPPR